MHIIQFIDAFQINDMVFIVLEYCANGCLFFYIDGNNGLPLSLALRFFYQIGTAIEYLHELKIAHRDIKPENILLDETLNAKLCDFGWSSMINDDEYRTSVCGTYEYMSPEIVSNGKYSHTEKVDIWCMGILMLELLSGKTPFHGETVDQIRNEHMNKSIQYNNKWPIELVDLISSMLETDPKIRPTMSKILKSPLFDGFRVNSPISSNEMSTLITNYMRNISSFPNRVIPELLVEILNEPISPKKKYNTVNLTPPNNLKLPQIVPEMNPNFKNPKNLSFEENETNSMSTSDQSCIKINNTRSIYMQKPKTNNTTKSVDVANKLNTNGNLYKHSNDKNSNDDSRLSTISAENDNKGAIKSVSLSSNQPINKKSNFLNYKLEPISLVQQNRINNFSKFSNFKTFDATFNKLNNSVISVQSSYTRPQELKTFDLQLSTLSTKTDVNLLNKSTIDNRIHAIEKSNPSIDKISSSKNHLKPIDLSNRVSYRQVISITPRGNQLNKNFSNQGSVNIKNSTHDSFQKNSNNKFSNSVQNSFKEEIKPFENSYCMFVNYSNYPSSPSKRSDFNKKLEPEIERINKKDDQVNPTNMSPVIKSIRRNNTLKLCKEMQ